MQRIFIGDVQGCADELEEMAERARGQFGEAFEMWLVGDLVNRGPHSPRVLRRIRDAVAAGRARVVLGNHELGLLRTAFGLRELGSLDSFGEVLDAPDAGAWIDWLRRLPLVATGRLGGQDFAMVHAATHPDWPIQELCARARRVEARLAGDFESVRRFLAKDPADDPDRDALERLTCCRSVSSDGRWSPDPPTGAVVAWHRAWARRKHGFGLVYGHWALQGLHVAPWLRGLDTGCVHHGRGRNGALTAWIPDPSSETPFDVPDDGFWQVPARRAYYAHRDAVA